MSWSLFEYTHPRNIFVFGRDGVEHTPYNTYVIIANDYNMAKRILENICGYFAPWIEIRGICKITTISVIVVSIICKTPWIFIHLKIWRANYV